MKHFSAAVPKTALSSLAVLLLSTIRTASGEDPKLPPASEKAVDFYKDVEPLFQKRCVKCHGANKQKSKFRLDTRDDLLKGGEIGKAVIEGKSAESPLVLYIAGLDKEVKMPPEGDPLTPQEIGLVRAWIDQGIKWPARAAEEKKGPVLRFLKGQQKWVTNLAYGPEGKMLATVGGETLLFKPGEVKLWDSASGEVKAVLAGHEKAVWGVAFDREGKTLATCGYDKLVKLWDVTAGKERASLQGHANWVTCVAFSPDGKRLASGSEDTTVKLWDVSNGKEETTFKGHTGTVRSLAFSPDGHLLATASFDGTVKLWDVEKKAEVATLKGHTGEVWSVAFSPDGKMLATGGADGTVKLWGAPEGKDASAFAEKGTLKGHKNWVACVVFSPDGKRLASSGFDSAVKVWSVERQAEVASLDGLKTTVWSVAFNQPGKSLALALSAVEGEESTVKFWDIPKEQRHF